MSILTDIQFLSRRYLNKAFDFQAWKIYMIMKINSIEDEEKAQEVARHFAVKEEDDSNV
jgi:hypothetical protein